MTVRLEADPSGWRRSVAISVQPRRPVIWAVHWWLWVRGAKYLSAGGGTRTIPIDDFFVGVRETDLRRDEGSARCCRAPQRRTEEDSTLILSKWAPGARWRSPSFRLPTISRRKRMIQLLVPVWRSDRWHRRSSTYAVRLRVSGWQKLSSIGASESEEFAAKVLEYASPISDLRASAWYRREVLCNISKSIFEDR